MQLPIIPGRTRTEEAIPALFNPANSLDERVIVVPADTPTTIARMKNCRTLVIQIQSEFGVMVRWSGDGVPPAAGNSMYLPAATVVAVDVAESIPIVMAGVGGPASVYILQLGGKYE